MALRARTTAKAKPKAKTGGKRASAIVDLKYWGPEPDLRGDVSRLDLIKAYNWYNSQHDPEDAKKFVLEYLREFKKPKDMIKSVSKIDPLKLRNIGWNCRILMLGGNIPAETEKRVFANLDALVKEANKVPEVKTEEEAPKIEKPVVSIQDRIRNHAHEMIAFIEDEIDVFIREGASEFSVGDWLRQNDVKAPTATIIANYYKPLYSELYDAVLNKDPDLVYAYRHWKKAKLKQYAEFIRQIVAECESRSIIVKTIRKPRAKKVKPATAIVAKVQYKLQDDTYNVKSIQPTEIVGADQLWVFNSKYRTLSVYNALGPSGLSVKGTTLIGFDEKTSITKKLRKPEDVLKNVLNGGKIVLRRLMDGIKCKESQATGRLNTECILLRIIK